MFESDRPRKESDRNSGNYSLMTKTRTPLQGSATNIGSRAIFYKRRSRKRGRKGSAALDPQVTNSRRETDWVAGAAVVGDEAGVGDPVGIAQPAGGDNAGTAARLETPL